jgi:CheY-like chemotaxis protein
MSDSAHLLNETAAPLKSAPVPTIYFIDDSATMREVIKIAFRKENLHVVTCPDAATALAQFSVAAPDAVITDVIMPDKDGYEVCDFIKHHEQFNRTPVILMSGVVNKTVAEKAMAVKADELIRKPFHPQDLIARVKGLLGNKFSLPASPSRDVVPAGPLPAPGPVEAAKTLANFFAPPAETAPLAVASGPQFAPAPTASQIAAPRVAAPAISAPVASVPPANGAAQRPPVAAPSASSPVPPGASSTELQKLRNEIRRLELLVKKLQTELEASREYCSSLEAHVKTLQD